ncbi:hypothetical protein [Acinetobacter sp. YH12126]|uniref:hypothetical protein n=1 Tax=Acinetobacter sp. YH12126 TaxID=2601111 RepID=UPI0015D13152|nr:hypothetical protein [Acinetobacter sp. YH12126]
MTIYQSSVKNIVQSSVTYKAYSETTGIKARYRDADGGAIGAKSITSGNLKFDLTYGFSEQILPNSIRFKLGGETYIDRTGTLYRNIDQNNGSGTLSGEVKYGTGEINLSSWAPNTDNILTLESLATTTDLPPLSHISFRTPVIPLRPSSLTVVVGTLEYGQHTLTADENGVIETSRAHGLVNWDNGFVQIYFYTKTEVTVVNRTELEAEDWYDPLLEYEEAGKVYINVPVWVDASSVRYNAIAYTYLPIDSELLGLSATRLPIDGRVPIFRVGGIGIVSSTKSQELPSAIAGTTYDLNDQRIAWCELEDANGVKVSYDLYTVDYDYGRVTLGGDFTLLGLVEPLTAKYRYQDMGQIRDVQINGQVTFTKPLTHNYDAVNTIVGSALVINDMQARYTRKFVQQAWSNQWLDEPTGTLISANYNDALYPIQITNKGAIQERWYLQFTDATNFKCVGEYTGQIATGTINTDFSPINPVTGSPYFVIKKEGWANGNVLRFNTVAANFPVWVIRTVKQSEPAVLSDQFQIMLRGDIDRVV